ncbi:hypothetical protein NKG94_30375 [Micromonospora sp. M12]
MTGRRAARDHEERPTGPAVGDDPAPIPPCPGAPGSHRNPGRSPAPTRANSGRHPREVRHPGPAHAGRTGTHPGPADPGGTRTQSGPARLTGPAGRRG